MNNAINITNEYGVQLRNVRKVFGHGEAQVEALRGVDFDTQFGELSFLVGPSGCGKTTLISIVAGLLDRTAGEMNVLGTNLDALSGSERVLFRRRNLGFIHTVRHGDPLFELDVRHLRADLTVREQAVAVARARTRIAESRLADLQRQLHFAEQVTDKRAISADELTRRRSAVETATAELDEVRSEISAAEAQVAAVQTELERSVIRAPIAAEVLQVKIRVGEFAPATATPSPLILLGRAKPLHVRVDVDEHEAWRVREGAHAVGHVRGNADLKAALQFVRFEPFIVPKRSLTGDSTERVDTRVLQVIFRVAQEQVPLFIGQQLDVFIDAASTTGDAR